MVKTRTVGFGGDRREKLRVLGSVFNEYLVDVLDVGCDVKYLMLFAERYVGVDIAGQPDICLDLEQGGLCFRDGSIGTVVAVDVLEHVDQMHVAFDEVCRVSRGYVVVGLPNGYELVNRLRFLLGQGLGGKYGLPCDRPADRHRWLFGLAEAKRFVQERGWRNGFELVEEVYVYRDYRRRWLRLPGRVVKGIGPRWAGLLAVAWWGVLRRGNVNDVN
jgi:hypothetical protein